MGPKLFWGPPGGPLPLPAKGRPFASAGAFFSISPEILKPIRRERRVVNGRSNRLVAKIVLDRSGVPPIVGQLVAARVAQHMAADLEREARRLASTRNHALVTCHEVAGVPQVGPFYSGCRWSLAGEAHLFWGCPHRLGIRGPYAYDGSIRRGDEKPRGHLKKFGGSKLRDRRSATRQSGSESRTSGERAG